MRVRFSLPAQMRPQILLIVGPTASGKSDLAVRLAKSLDGEIISADSRQVYKGLNIGTGKITRKEMGKIPHYLLDVANPKKQFTAAEYKKLARKKIEEILRKGKTPIIVGGTGFYIDSLFTNLPEVPPNQRLRKKMEKLSTSELFEQLKIIDPRRAKSIDSQNRVRLIRALEIAHSLGRVPKTKTDKLNADLIWIGLNPEKLPEKIYRRLVIRLPGMLREVKKLHENGLGWKRMEELGLEYRFLARYFLGKLSKQKMTKELFTAICQYARRQMTWFKRNEKINWFENSDDAFDTTLKLMGSVRQKSLEKQNSIDS